MKKKLWLLVILQCLFLLIIAGQHYAVLAFGKEILLKTAPIDPRDPFRGEFARLGYEISQIPVPNEETECKETCKVYVLLEKQGDYYQYKAASFTDQFVPTDQQIVVEGKTRIYKGASQPELNVQYGIEQVFVEEGRGRPLETSEGEVSVSVKVYKGKAVLQHVFVNGQLYE